MVNSIYPGKRQGELIEALTKLPQKIRDNINVRIAGYKDEMSDYVRNLHRTISQNGLENVVNIDDAVKEVEKSTAMLIFPLCVALMRRLEELQLNHYFLGVALLDAVLGLLQN